jgi:hypothetical protein
MKRIAVIMFCLCLFITGQAQVSRTINIVAGTLAGAFTPAEKKTITTLKVTGTLNASDLFFVRDSLTVIQTLDLGEARIISPLDSIPDQAIYKKTTLKSFIAPAGLTYIGQAAFLGCTSLSTIQLPKTIKELGSSAFSICGITSIELPATIVKIGGACFWSCSSLVKATVPYSNNGGDLFSGCDNLTTVIVPEGVTTIKDGAFYQLTSLTNIKLPSTITSIGTHAFYNCINLDSITIPEGVTSIGQGAFWQNMKLKSVKIPSSLTTLEDAVFSSCSLLTSLVFPKGLTTIKRDVFGGCSGLTTITIPYGNDISNGYNIFGGCSKLKTIIIPDGLTSIKNYAFNGCPANVTTFKIPASVKSIGNQAFAGCTGIDSISIPDSVTSIGTYAFSGCTGLKFLSMPSSVTKLGMYSFQNCGNLTTINLPATLSVIDEGVFSGCSGLTSISFPASITSLGKSAFAGCKALVINSIPVTVNSLGESCFSGCNGLKSIVIPSSISAINNATFSGCTGLNSVQFSNPNISIGYQAFLGCNGLTSITLPANTTISYNAFQNCKGLVQATTPYAYNSGNIFAGCDNLKTILIPSGTVSICSNGFYNCSTLDSISIPSSVQTIGNYAFYGCSSLKKFNLPPFLFTIGDYALANCSSLTSINIPATLQGISNYCFSKCSGLTYVDIPFTIKTINSYAFDGCTGLTSISVNNSFPIDLTQSTSVFNNVNKTTCQLNVPYRTKSRYSATNQWSDFANIVEKSTGIFVSSNKAELSANPGSNTAVDVKANVAWTASSNQSWLTVSPASGTGDSQLTFTSDNSQITTIRNAIVTVSAPGFISQTVVLSQKLSPKTVYISAGGLSSALTADELSSLSTLIVTGTMDARDFKTMRDSMPQLNDLDLTGVSIAAYTGVNGTYSYSTVYSANMLPIYAFYNNNTGIGKSTLKSVILPSTLSTIGTNAFSACTGLRNLSIPSAVNTINNYAFSNCSGLMSITIPASITTLGSYVFYNCTSLTSIIANSSYPVNLSSSSYVFYNVNSTNCSLYVPYGSKSIYAAAVQWGNFSNIIEKATGFLLSTNKLKLAYDARSSVTLDLKSNVTWTVSSDQPWLTLNPVTGSGNSTLTLTAETNSSSTTRKAIVIISAPDCIPQTVEVIQNIAPKTISIKAGGLQSELSTDELSSLSSLIITGTMDARDFKTIRDRMPLLSDLDLSGVSISAYKGYEGTGVYDSIYVANTIPIYAFFNSRTNLAKTSLKTIKIPSTVSAIGNYAFQNSNGLITFTIPETVASLGTYTFFNCTGLTSIYVNSSYPIDLSASWSTFYNINTATCTLYVPYKAKSLYAAAYQWSAFTNIVESTQGFITGTNKVKIAYIKGSTGTVDIAANVGWTASSDQSWLSVSPLSGSGDSKLTFTADKNDSTARRYAKVTITSPGYGSQIITVTQTGSPKTINITAGSLSTGLTAEELSSIADLNITGTIDARDFRTLRDKMPELARLDISKATIIAFSGTGGTYDFSTWYLANAIPPSAFYTYSPEWSKTSLISIKLPSTLSAIGSSAFQGCTGLTSIYLNSVYPLDLTNSGDPFYKMNKVGCTLYVPYATSSLYKNADIWNSFGGIIENSTGFLVNQRAVKFNSSVKSKSVVLKIKTNVAWLAQSDKSWLVVSPDISTNDSVLTLTAEANLADTVRKATITVSSPGFYPQTVYITQAAAPRKVTAGGLSTLLNAAELSTMTDLALMGTVDARDFKTMRDNMPALANLDLTDVNVVAYQGKDGTARSGAFTNYPDYEIPREAFSYYIKSVILPETTVSIGNNSFGNAGNLIHIEWPSKLRFINDYAFFTCTKLPSVSFPDSLVSIGIAAFQGCSALNGQLTLPLKLKKIGASAFYNCGGLKGVLTIPASVDSIGGNAFYNCYGLSSLVINSANPIIGINSFSSCSGLKSITFPTTLTAIGEGAFGYCINLKTISLPPSLKIIGANAFQVCTGITSIDFPASLTTIGDYAFTNSGLINVTIPATLTDIGTYAFSHCTSLNSVSFPSTLKKISDGLFTSCTSLYPILLPSGLEIIGKDAFNSCTALTNIDFPASLTTIGDYAFQYCTGFTKITLPNKLVSIGSCSFLSCTGLTAIVIPNSVTSVGSSAFSNCTVLKNITFGSSLTGISDYVFNSCSGLNSVMIPNTIKSIGADAFKSCTGLTTITIPNSVTSIGSDAFTYCSSLNNVIIPNSITSIQAGTFSNCTGLKSITIPNSVQTIGYAAFSHCTSLNNLTIPNSVTVITDAAFEYCSSLTSIVIPNLINTLKYNTFSHCTNLSSVTIPNSVTRTEAQVFGYCTALTNITLPVSLTNIGHYFFSNCTGLSSIIIPNSVTVINTGAFEYCSNLKKVTIANSVNSIEDGAFKNCNTLPSISIPASVTSIGSAAFSGTGLNSVYVYSQTPILINSWTSIFDNVNKNTCILYVPAGTKASYRAAYGWQDFVNIIEMTTAVPTLLDSRISIYPNPIHESFSISGQTESALVTLIDMSGKQLVNRQVGIGEIVQVGDLLKGLYIIRIITTEGRIERKLIKE